MKIWIGALLACSAISWGAGYAHKTIESRLDSISVFTQSSMDDKNNEGLDSENFIGVNSSYTRIGGGEISGFKHKEDNGKYQFDGEFSKKIYRVILNKERFDLYEQTSENLAKNKR